MSGPAQRITVCGLGYVGAVSAACLSRDGHQVTGVDVSSDKVDRLSRGESPIIEPGVAALLAEGVRSGRLHATTDLAAAIAVSDVAIVCVGTPSSESGAIDLQFVERVSRQIGAALRDRTEPFTLLVRSTVIPGTTEDLVRPAVVAGFGPQVDVRLGFHPEFLREATAIADYDAPARVVVGCDRQATVDVVDALYPRLTQPTQRVSFRLAELIKYADNAFHALKVAFANEIGAVCKANSVSGRELMELFVQDDKLNISREYLRPGAPFGGSCLPKDLRALTHLASQLSVETVLLKSVLHSNDVHKRRVFNLVRSTGARRVAVLGLSFKHATDDLRESPAVELVETLLGKGYEVRVFDPTIRTSALIGSNLSYISRELPHLERLLAESLEDAISGSEAVVVTTRHPAFAALRDQLAGNQTLIDLVSYIEPGAPLTCSYDSVCW